MGQGEQGPRPATNLRWSESDAKVPRMKKTDIPLFFERLSAADPTSQTKLASVHAGSMTYVAKRPERISTG